VPHRNAPLSELGRLRLARVIVEQGWPVARAAERFQVSRPTAQRWATRYRAMGAAGMTDRSSRPHHSPRRTPAPLVRKIVHLRWTQRLGPAQIAPRVGLAASTVHQVLVRCRISRLAYLDRATGQPVRRYEHDRPGALVHIDVKKLGNIPAGGGHRFLGRATGGRNSQADRSSGQVSRHRNPLIGHGFIHAAVDDHSRLAYAEIHGDETGQTAAGFLHRAQAWFADHGVVIQRVLTDNGGCYRSHLWAQTCQQLGITATRTRPYRPQTNGKVERFNRTLVEGWAYRRLYPSEATRRAAFAPWLHWYNYHRPHSAIGGHPPINRCTNLPEPYS
jgi:Integrase core domain/leucine-zipper of insertion element IS481